LHLLTYPFNTVVPRNRRYSWGPGLMSVSGPFKLAHLFLVQVNSPRLCLGARHHKQRKLLNPAFSTARMRDMTPLFHGIAAQESSIHITGNYTHSLKRLSAASGRVTGIICLFTGDRRRQDHEPLSPRSDWTRRTRLYIWATGWSR